MMIIIIRTQWMKRKRENWSIKNNGEQNEDHVMEKRACYTIILNCCLCEERHSKAVISSTLLKDTMQALEYSISLENKPDSQPGPEFGTSPSFTFKEVIWRIWQAGAVYNNAEYVLQYPFVPWIRSSWAFSHLGVSMDRAINFSPIINTLEMGINMYNVN